MENKVLNYKIDGLTKEGDCCPECNENWDGGDILEHFKNVRSNPEMDAHPFYKDKSDEELLEVVASYGWFEHTPIRFGKLIGMELGYNDPERYDGVSYWCCPGCGVSWNRFNGERSERFIKRITHEKNITQSEI